MSKTPRILCTGLCEDEITALGQFCQAHDFPEVSPLTVSHADCLVGELAAGVPEPESAELLPFRACVFSGMLPPHIQKFMKKLDKTLQPRPAFAMITPTSATWKLTYLLEHLAEEQKRAKMVASRRPVRRKR